MTNSTPLTDSPTFKLRLAAHIIRSGGVIAYPTEAVFGVGCSPFDEAAIAEVLAIKQRPWHKGMILVGSDLAQFSPFIAPLPQSIVDKLKTPTDHPTTWVVPAAKTCSPLIRGQHETLAIRITSHPLVAQLCQLCDSPLISTSANLAGHSPATSALQVRLQLGDRLDYLLNGPLGGYHSPSEIRDALSDRVLRSA